MSRTSPTPTVPGATGAEPASGSEGMPLGCWIDGRYQIVRLLGRGGLGLVYEAEHARLGRRVAIKVLKDELAEHEALRPRFEREARVLASLSHPNVVGISDYGVWEKCPYLVMELLEGQTLRTRIKTVRVSEGHVAHLMTQLLQGLAYAHGCGIVHRDLKPGNVFLQSFPTQPDHLKILDFGFAKFVGPDHPVVTQLSRAGVVLGTPAYMAPEQILGDPTDARADVYAVGVMLYEMLTGEQPFQGRVSEVLRQQLRDALPDPEQARPELRPRPELVALLGRATAKSRDDRFQDALEMLNAFHAIPRPLFSWDTRGLPRQERPAATEAPTRVLEPRRRERTLRRLTGGAGRIVRRTGATARVLRTALLAGWQRGTREAAAWTARCRRTLEPAARHGLVGLVMIFLWLGSWVRRGRLRWLWIDARVRGWVEPRRRALSVWMRDRLWAAAGWLASRARDGWRRGAGLLRANGRKLVRAVRRSRRSRH